MSATNVLDRNDDFPVRTHQPVHSGKVRSVYWLSAADSARLVASRGYSVAPDAELALMVISDRLSAFDCIWRGENGLDGVPGKGAALNAVSQFWFEQFAEAGLARSHVLEVPHPLVWVVQRAQPISVEAIARRYIAGSMWRAYAAGERAFCGIRLPEGLHENQRLGSLLITPSTKGVLQGIPGVPAVDDVNVQRAVLEVHWPEFGFRERGDVDRYETLLRDGFQLIESHLSRVNQLLVDTKFEFGYAANKEGALEMIYMDEVGTPDSSRFWDAEAFATGKVIDSSKESFRQALLAWAPEPQVLLDKSRMRERLALAEQSRLPEAMLLAVSQRYTAIAERITGQPIEIGERPRDEIMAVLGDTLQLV